MQTCVAYDADEQARNLHGWSQTYDQLTAGRFVGGLTELCLDHMQVFVETTSHTLRQTCEVQEDAYWFGIPTCPDGLRSYRYAGDLEPMRSRFVRAGSNSNC